MTTSQVFTAAAGAPTPISAQMQQALCTWATSSANRGHGEEVLRLLAKRSDLSPATEEILAKSGAAKVKAAWLSRPGRSRDDILNALKREKRATVLAAVAASDEATPELLSALGEDTRLSVLLSVFDNPKTPREAMVGVIIRMQTAHWSYAVDAKVRQYINEHPQAVNALSEGVSTNQLARFLDFDSITSKAGQMNYAHAVFIDQAEKIINGTLKAGYGNSHIEHAATILGHPNLDDEVGQKVADTVERARPRSGKLSNDLEKLLEYYSADPEVRGGARKRQAAYREQVELVATGDDTNTDEIVTLIEWARGLGWARQRESQPILMAAMRNPNLPDRAVIALAPTLVWGDTDKFAARYMRPDLGASAQAALGAILINNPNLIESPLAAETLGRYPELVGALLTELSQTESHSWSNEVRAVGALLRSDALSAQSLRLVPWKIFNSQEIPPKAAAALVALLDSLGANMEAWETLGQVGKDFDGTVGELVDIAAALNPHD